MTNYISAFRSNKFKVKDKEAFNAWMGGFIGEDNMEVWDESDGTVGFGWYDHMPLQRYDEAKDENEDANFMEELSKHLAEGEVAVVQEIGNEKLRYLIGYSEAVTWTGERHTVSIDDIFTWAKEKGGQNVTDCTY